MQNCGCEEAVKGGAQFWTLTFQVVVCHQAQRHHEGQFLQEETVSALACMSAYTHIRTNLPLGSPPSWVWEEETVEEWRMRGR